MCKCLQFINFLKARIKEITAGNSTYTATVMLVGVPNVGKSVIANAMHKLGRISAQGISLCNEMAGSSVLEIEFHGECFLCSRDRRLFFIFLKKGREAP